MTALRKKIHGIIDEIPEQSLRALEPLLTHLIDEDSDLDFVIEPITDPEELAMMNEGLSEYERDPSSFVPLSEIKWD